MTIELLATVANALPAPTRVGSGDLLGGKHITYIKSMNELEIALQQNNSELDHYLENVKTSDFRLHINQLLEQRENQDCHALKQKIKAAIDAA